jgi:hypothetical protein
MAKNGRDGTTAAFQKLSGGMYPCNTVVMTPMSTATPAAIGSERSIAHAAAAMAVTVRVTNSSELKAPYTGASSTPARAAMKLEMIHATATTPLALMPSSWTSRRLSTAPRICSPRLVKRSRMVSRMRTTTVTEMVAR